MKKKILLIPWFKKFIRETENGSRCKLDGTRMKGTIRNYYMVLSILQAFEAYTSMPIRIRTIANLNPSIINRESNYWDQLAIGSKNYYSVVHTKQPH
jgi:hypothetical protein